MKTLILSLLMLITTATFAQNKPLLESQEDVEAMAIKEFDQAMQPPEGVLYLFAQENNINGAYTFKVTLGDRGKVTSVFVKGRDGGTIPMQNKLKDAVKAFKLNFKLPKNKDYSLEYQFKF